nr:hypothetical protein [Tanacetum cinerariifolium]
MDGETKILAKVNGRQRTISESSIRRHLKLNDEKDETAFTTGDVIYGEAFPTVTHLNAGQDRENIAKTSAMPHEASPRVTSLGGGEGNERKIFSVGCSIHGGMDQREDLLVGDIVKDSDKSVDKGSDSTDEMANVLGTLGAKNILASGGLRLVFTTASLSVASASIVVSPIVTTASGSFPTAVIFTTASVTTPTIRVTRSSRGVVIESLSPISVTEAKQPSKEKVLKQMSAQLARDLEAKFAQEDQIIREQAERDSEIARIHAERELEMMIAELDRSNEIVAKYLSEYKQAEAGLSHDEKVELIDELLMYQRNLAQIKKYQAQQNKPATKTKRRNFYMSILRSNAVWEKMQDFVPMNSKLKSKRLKRPGIRLGKVRFKKLKTAEVSGTEPSQEQQFEEPKELSEEELNKIIEEDLDRLWSLVKETCSIREVTDKKEKELWVKLKRLYEPDSRDPLWDLQRYMHDPLVWRLYYTCGVHHVSTGRGHEIFMLVEKDYLLTKGLTTLMLCNKLQVDQYSEMANELLMKIYIIANKKMEYIGEEKSSLHDQRHQQAALGKEDDEEFGEICWCQNRRDLPSDIPLDSVVVLRYEKRSKSENKGKVPIEMELVLEQTQQGSSYEVSKSQDHKMGRLQDDAKRLCLVDDLKKLKDHIHVRTKELALA